MRHRVAHRKLGRVTEHRISMLRNQATALLKYEHLTTTVPKAKELRPFVERLITVAKRGLAAGEANAKVLNARRLVMEDLQDRDVVSKLFDTIAPRFAARPGGYTRLMRTGYRKGDSAELAMVELIGSEFDPNANVDVPADEAKPKAKGVGGRLRAAAERLRGTKKGDDESRKVTAKPTKGAGAGRRSTTPRKAGGS
ncbi:MAG: rplQ [Acidobacteria bacterium]|jgi:large subunit ribosomal protein L17|nr:rplQ [Acidobacteriota bacterium]